MSIPDFYLFYFIFPLVTASAKPTFKHVPKVGFCSSCS